MTPEQKAKHLAAITTHGAYVGGQERPEHYVWRTMIARCTRPTNVAYKYYGARGITVCKRWMQYEKFFEDMGERPSPDHSLERKNTNKGYMPSNCRWATRSEQQKNKTTTKFYTNGSFIGTLVECAQHIGMSKQAALYRMRVWKTFEKGVKWRQLQKAV
jgi:hypothetical protein